MKNMLGSMDLESNWTEDLTSHRGDQTLKSTQRRERWNSIILGHHRLQLSVTEDEEISSI
jgi:hypothetical protein